MTTLLSIGTGVEVGFSRYLYQPKHAVPKLLAAPFLLGSGRTGEGLIVNSGEWQGIPVPNFVFQWFRDGIALFEATEPVYYPRPEDTGSHVSCRITAINAAGSNVTETAGITVVSVAPPADLPIADAIYFQNLGVQILDAFLNFNGDELRFNVTGQGVSIDPDTGVLNISTDALQTGMDILVSVSNPEGTISNSFKVFIQPVAGNEVVGSAPALLSAPELTGSGVIGEALSADPGTWESVTALGYQWLRNGEDISDATDQIYILTEADDLCTVSCAVTARNDAGSTIAITEGLVIVQPAPSTSGPLADVIFVQGSGKQTLDAGEVFSGPALVFSASGAGAVIDEVTGILTFLTDALIAGEQVRVRCTNSGGAVESGFKVSIVPGLLVPTIREALPNVVYRQGTGTQTLSAQAGFEGSELRYSLEAAPDGITVDTGSGLVSIPTDTKLKDGIVTVKVVNTAGEISQSFKITVQSRKSVFDTKEALSDITFLTEGKMPEWTFNGTEGAACLVPAAEGRLHGAWVFASGDGLYRCRARWNTGNSTISGLSPFVLGARILQDGTNFNGLYVEAFRPEKGAKYLRIQQYTGKGTTTRLLAEARPGWVWGEWYWIELKIAGTAVQARIYPDGVEIPDWQATGTTDALDPGAFGPGGFPFDGVSPDIFIQQLEFEPLAFDADETPAAAQNQDWSLAQFTEQA